MFESQGVSAPTIMFCEEIFATYAAIYWLVSAGGANNALGLVAVAEEQYHSCEETLLLELHRLQNDSAVVLC